MTGRAAPFRNCAAICAFPRLVMAAFIFLGACGTAEEAAEEFGVGQAEGEGPGLKPVSFCWAYAGVKTPASLR